MPRTSRTAKDPVRLRRAIVLLMSVQGRTVKDITSLMRVGEDYVRDAIHAFNERGLDPLDPKWSGGRPRAIGERVREHICPIARTPPPTAGHLQPVRRRDAHARRPRPGHREDLLRDPTSEFAALRHFALNGTDHRAHEERNAAIAAYEAASDPRGTDGTGIRAHPSHYDVGHG